MANELKPAQRVALARNPERPGTAEFVSALFTDFFEQRGDRCCMDDGAIYGGVGLFHGKPVTVIGHRKGHTLEEHVAYHFGMPSPEGYRKRRALTPAWRPRPTVRARPSPRPWRCPPA